MRALPAVAAVEPEPDERGSRLRARLDRRGGVRPVVAEDVSCVGDLALVGQPTQLAGEVSPGEHWPPAEGPQA